MIVTQSQDACLNSHGCLVRVERKRLLAHTLKLRREWGDDSGVAKVLMDLSDTNRLMGLHEEGIRLAREALGIFERLGDTVGQAQCLQYLAWLLYDDEQLDAAGETASRAIDLIPEKGYQTLVCDCHRLFGHIYRSKGEREKAIYHYEVALEIASSSNSHGRPFWSHYALAELFLDEDTFDDAHAHVEQAKSHAVNDPYKLGRAMELQAEVWYKQGRLEEARSEALRAVDFYQKFGASRDVEDCRGLLQRIEEETNNPVVSG